MRINGSVVCEDLIAYATEEGDVHIDDELDIRGDVHTEVDPEPSESETVALEVDGVISVTGDARYRPA